MAITSRSRRRAYLSASLIPQARITGGALTLHEPASGADGHEITVLRRCRHGHHSPRSAPFIVAISHAGGWLPLAPESMRHQALSATPGAATLARLPPAAKSKPLQLRPSPLARSIIRVGRRPKLARGRKVGRARNKLACRRCWVDRRGQRSLPEFLGEAQALLFPIDWPEPFGLVMIEAMAYGTPVLAFRHGSVSEIIDQGVTGAIVDTMDEAVMMLPRVIELDRRAVRRRFEQRFSSVRMATDYVAVYHLLLNRPSISQRETTVPMPPLGFGKRDELGFMTTESAALPKLVA